MVTAPETGKNTSPRHHPTSRTAQGRNVQQLHVVVIVLFMKIVRTNNNIHIAKSKSRLFTLYQIVQMFSNQLVAKSEEIMCLGVVVTR